MIGLVAAIGFVVWERRAPAPMLPRRLFRSRGFPLGVATAFFVAASLYVAVFFMAQYLQAELGVDSLGAGLRLLPWTATLFVTAPLAGALADRVGYRPVLSFGLFAQTIGMAWLAVGRRRIAELLEPRRPADRDRHRNVGRAAGDAGGDHRRGRRARHRQGRRGQQHVPGTRRRIRRRARSRRLQRRGRPSDAGRLRPTDSWPRWPSPPRSPPSRSASHSPSPDQKDCDHANDHIDHVDQRHRRRRPTRVGLDAARRGDREAFDTLIAPLRDQLLAHCYRMLGSIHDADDALQDTHVASVEGIARLRREVRVQHLALPHRHQRVARRHQPQRPPRAPRRPDRSTRQRARKRCGGSNRSPTRSDPKGPRPPWSAASRSSWRS